MSPHTKKPAKLAPSKAPAAKPAKGPEAKEAKSGKAAKAAAAEAPVAAAPAEGEGVDLEELEEQQEEARAASGGSNAAALAAASGTTEISASFKNFRHHPDMENFYRFIFENDLRHEALAIIDQIMIEKLTRKSVKMAKAHAH